MQYVTYCQFLPLLIIMYKRVFDFTVAYTMCVKKIIHVLFIIIKFLKCHQGTRFIRQHVSEQC